MKRIKQLSGAVRAIGETIAQRATGLYEQAFPRALEKRFIKEWAAVLTTNAKVYTGMYASLVRVADGKSKKPEKVLREWTARAAYQWENSSITELCKRTLSPASESGSAEDCARWARLLLQAAKQAGVTKDRKDTVLTLDDSSIRAYTEWDGQDIYPEDTVKVMLPAWYQKGRVLEQGQCTLVTGDDAAEMKRE